MANNVGEQFKPGHIPTAEEIKNRVNEATAISRAIESAKKKNESGQGFTSNNPELNTNLNFPIAVGNNSSNQEEIKITPISQTIISATKVNAVTPTKVNPLQVAIRAKDMAVSDAGRFVTGKKYGGGLETTRQIEQPIISIYPQTQPKPLNFVQRYDKAIEGRDVFGRAKGGIAPIATIGFVGSEISTVASKFPYEQIPMAVTKRKLSTDLNVVNEYGKPMISPEQLKVLTPSQKEFAGYYSKGTNIENVSFIKSRITESRSYVKDLAKESGDVFFTGLPFYMSGTNVGSSLLVLSGAEKLSSRRGKDELKEDTLKWGGLPVPYAIPYGEVGLGVAGLGAGMKENYLQRLEEKKPTVTKTIMLKSDERQFVVQLSKKEVPSIFFKNDIGADVNTLSFAELKRVGRNKFQIQGGLAYSEIRTQNLFTGKYSIEKIPVSFFGNIAKTKARRLTNLDFKTARQVTNIKNPYSGYIKVLSMDDDLRTEESIFGGFPVMRRDQTSIVLSGELTNGRKYKNTARGILDYSTIGVVQPSGTKPYNAIVFGKKAQVSLMPTESITDFEIIQPTKSFDNIKDLNIRNEIMGQQILETSFKLRTPSMYQPFKFSVSSKSESSLKSGLKLSPISVSKQKEKQEQIIKVNVDYVNPTKVKTFTDVIQYQPQPQKTRQKIIPDIIEDIETPIPIFISPRPRIPKKIIGFDFNFKKVKPKKLHSKKKNKYSTFTIAGGFTSSVFGRTKVYKKKDFFNVSNKYSSLASLREIPVFR